VTEALERTDLPPQVRRALEIKQEAGGAAVKKINAMKRGLTRDGRVKDTLLYCGARRTGRWAGRVLQLQNMKAGGPDWVGCPACGTKFAYSGPAACFGCGCALPEGIEVNEWGDESTEAALEAIRVGNLNVVQSLWGSLSALIGSCTRGLITAAPGHDLICSDFSAIEAVVLAALAGCEWRLEVFRTHGKIYEMSAAMITGIPFEEIIAHKEQTGKHHKVRKSIGKVAELACFTHDTQVLTDRGYVRMVGVTKNDLLWDGVEWVKHEGVVSKGEREVITVDGVRVTPGHPVNINGSWSPAKELASNKNTLTRALETGSASIQSLNTKNEARGGVRFAGACVDKRGSLTCLTCTAERLRGAHRAGEQKPGVRGLKSGQNTPTLCRRLVTEGGSLTDYGQRSAGAIMKMTRGFGTTVDEGYRFAMNGGEKTADARSSSMSLRWMDGIIQTLRWTGQTTTGGMSPGISGSSPKSRTEITKGAFATSNPKYSTSKKKIRNSENVYDIMNVGPRNRFTIKTDSGHLLVHNSGYAGWIGAWKNFGADKFMNDDEIKENILKWREASPEIVEMWGGQYRKHPDRWEWTPELYGVEGCFVYAVLTPDTDVPWRDLTFRYHSPDDLLAITLPSGRNLVYHEPRLNREPNRIGLDAWRITAMGVDATTGRWVREETYSGKLVENIVQGAARDIQAAALVRLDSYGYNIVMHVHDEAAAEVPHGMGSVEHFEQVMMVREPWFADWPIRAAGGWRGKRFRK